MPTWWLVMVMLWEQGMNAFSPMPGWVTETPQAGGKWGQRQGSARTWSEHPEHTWIAVGGSSGLQTWERARWPTWRVQPGPGLHLRGCECCPRSDASYCSSFITELTPDLFTMTWESVRTAWIPGACWNRSSGGGLQSDFPCLRRGAGFAFPRLCSWYI